MASPAELANTQQLQKLSPYQVPLQQAVAEKGLQALQQPMGNVPFQPIAEERMRNFRTNTIPGIAERFTAAGGGQRSSSFQGALGSAGAQLESQLGALQSQHELQSEGLRQSNLRTLLSSGLNPTVDNLYTEQRPSGFQAFGEKVAEAAAPAVGQYATELGKEGLSYLGDKIKSGLGYGAAAATGAAAGKAAGTAGTAATTGGASGLGGTVAQTAGNVAGAATGQAVATTAAEQLVEKGAAYGSTISPTAAATVADSGLKSGGLLAAGGDPVKLIAAYGLLGTALAFFGWGVSKVLNEATNEYGQADKNIAKENAIEDAKNKKGAAQHQQVAQDKSAANKTARQEAIASGQYATAAEYESAQRQKIRQEIAEKADAEAKKNGFENAAAYQKYLES